MLYLTILKIYTSYKNRVSVIHDKISQPVVQIQQEKHLNTKNYNIH